MADISIVQACVVAITVLLAFAVRGGTGFGGGIVAVPIMALAMPLDVVVPLVSALNVSAGVSQSLRDWRRAAWQHLKVILPFALAGVMLGGWALARVDATLLSRAFGIFVICYSLYTLRGTVPSIPPRWLTPVAVVSSFLGGFTGAIFGGAAGPIFVIYLQSVGVEKDAFRATLSVLMVVLAGTRILAYAVTGMYTAKVLVLLAACLPLVLLGNRLGAGFVKRINQRYFNSLIALLLLASGATLLLR